MDSSLCVLAAMLGLAISVIGHIVDDAQVLKVVHHVEGQLAGCIVGMVDMLMWLSSKV